MNVFSYPNTWKYKKQQWRNSIAIEMLWKTKNHKTISSKSGRNDDNNNK